VGIVTLKDVAKRVIAEGRDVHRTYVSDIMSAPVVTINHISMVENAAKLMGEKKLKRLVVVDDKNRVAGIITALDVVSNLPNLVEVMFKTWVKPDWR
jgi:CBS domain-containing protein